MTLRGATFVCKNMNVTQTGIINGTGQGYPKGHGHVSGSAGMPYSGGCHGGKGGEFCGSGGSSCTGSSVLYGSISHPVYFGSGGADEAGQPGGGALRILVSEAFTLRGVIAVDGGRYYGNEYGGAGAGGSVLIETNVIRLAGFITAIGGVSSLAILRFCWWWWPHRSPCSGSI